jgi:hypothetical protein
MIKPSSLKIHAEYWPWLWPTLVGLDNNGNRWIIRWCGNGAYSHWLLYLENDDENGWYEFIYGGPEYEREQRSSLLEKQIRAAELKYGIYS